ncbi:methyl-accepting chemotaxis protein [Desulfitobacterium sp. THU1]|uniref:methyl-accepting chemotaxis protein n=1 Tax=Desulfitobacterium sp. THU1 TaxID=3138072 RepID=UPI0031203BF5
MKKPMFNLQSIRTKISLLAIALLLIPSIAIAISSYKTAANQVEMDMTNNAKDKVALLDSVITNFMDTKLKDTDYMSHLVSAKNPGNRTILDDFAKTHPDLLSSYLGTNEGVTIISPHADLPKDYDPRQRTWYKMAMENKGKVVLTPPYVDASTGRMVVSAAKATIDNTGVFGIDIDLFTLGEVSKNVVIGQAGYPIITDQAGLIIYHPTDELGSQGQGTNYDYMVQEESGQHEYLENNTGKAKHMVFATNKLTGWKVSATMYNSEFSQAANGILVNILIVLVAAILLGSIAIYFITRSIVNPLKSLATVSQKISEGNLTERVEVKSKDEIGKVGDNFNLMAASLQEILKGVANTSEQVAASSEELTASAGQHAQASTLVATAVSEVATSSVQQSESMTEAAKSVEQIVATIKQVAVNTNDMALSSNQTSDATKNGQEALQKAIQQMGHLSESTNIVHSSISDLEESSKEIGVITNVISQIADQTNLLALNAAIEAARAGENGRGFAVVADEVKKLAEQSQEAAKQINELIQKNQGNISHAVNSMEQGRIDVDNSIQVVNVAGESFEKIIHLIDIVVKGVQEVSAMTQQIEADSQEVLESVKNMDRISIENTHQTESVSAAIEEQTASVEEIAASSQTLAEMAQELQTLISKFRY